MMNEHDDRNENISKIAKLIEGIEFAMLTTIDEDGTLRSRPMATQQAEFDGEIWFFTYANSHKVHEVEQYNQVNLSYADPDDNRYVSISGTASLVRDRQKMEELWNPVLKAWFPNGLDEPGIALLKVTATKAEYWDSPSSSIVQLIGFTKAIVTGETYKPGENEKINIAKSGNQ
jgi:general stress protein 26